MALLLLVVFALVALYVLGSYTRVGTAATVARWLLRTAESFTTWVRRVASSYLGRTIR